MALIYKFFENKVFHVFAAFALLSVILCFFFPSKQQIEICACAVSAAICLPLERKFIKFTDTKDWKKLGLRALVGFACVGGVFLTFSILPFAFLELYAWKFVKYFLTIATATLLVPYLFKKLKIEK